MNKLYWYVRGYYRLSITGPASDQVLNRLVKAHIPFWDLQHDDDVTMHLCIFESNLDEAKQIALHCLCLVEREDYVGMKENIRNLLKRPVMVVGVMLCVLIIFVMQNFLLFFKVEGNEQISHDEILRALSRIDVQFGVTGATLNPKQIKDQILNIAPSLQWITITQNGSVAQVVVRERTDRPQTSTRKGLANVVAAKPAMITEQFVFEGQRLKEPGDFVSKGDMLVSGVVDLEKTYLIVRAQAEIYGRTWYEKSVVMPEKCLNKEPGNDESWCIWMEIGKRRIKILGNSRIYHIDCDKIKMKKNVTLPGGYRLPIALVLEKQKDYTVSELTVSKEVAEEILCEYAQQSVLRELCAGEVQAVEYEMGQRDRCHILEAKFTCREMIAEISEGKWNEEDFNHD